MLISLDLDSARYAALSEADLIRAKIATLRGWLTVPAVIASARWIYDIQQQIDALQARLPEGLPKRKPRPRTRRTAA